MKLSNNPHANKKHHLKPAFILCGVMLVIIVIMYISSNNVNKNVAENMTGYMLYSAEDEALFLYSFNEKEAKEIANGADDACFMADNRILIIRDNVISLFNTESDKEEEFLSYESGTIIETDYCTNKKIAAVLWKNENEQGIDIVDTEKNKSDKILNEVSNITSICFSADGKTIYYAQETDKGSSIYTLSVSGGQTEKITDVKDVSVSGMDVYENAMYLSCSDDAVYKLNLRTERVSEMDFCSDEYICTDLCVAYETQYIIVSDKSGSMEIYVCNGSNMDKVDLEHEKILTLFDYFKD